MKVRDPQGRYEAKVKLESRKGNRFDKDEHWRLIVRDLQTGKEVLSRYFGTSYSYLTEIETGRNVETIDWYYYIFTKVHA